MSVNWKDIDSSDNVHPRRESGQDFESMADDGEVILCRRAVLKKVKPLGWTFHGCGHLVCTCSQTIFLFSTFCWLFKERNQLFTVIRNCAK